MRRHLLALLSLAASCATPVAAFAAGQYTTAGSFSAAISIDGPAFWFRVTALGHAADPSDATCTVILSPDGGNSGPALTVDSLKGYVAPTGHPWSRVTVFCQFSSTFEVSTDEAEPYPGPASTSLGGALNALGSGLNMQGNVSVTDRLGYPLDAYDGTAQANSSGTPTGFGAFFWDGLSNVSHAWRADAFDTHGFHGPVVSDEAPGVVRGSGGGYAVYDVTAAAGAGLVTPTIDCQYFRWLWVYFVSTGSGTSTLAPYFVDDAGNVIAYPATAYTSSGTATAFSWGPGSTGQLGAALPGKVVFSATSAAGASARLIVVGRR